jgi:hypothetical protein
MTAASRPVLIAAALLCLLPAGACPAGTTVADAVGRLDVASYTDILDNMLLTHEGDNRGFTAQYTPTAGHDLARDTIFSWFDGLGLDASLDPFTFSSYTGCNNVLGILPGRITPDRVYVIGGHYDSVNNPGADDNASGVAGVMEAARILADLPLASTVMFAAWDAEEKGLRGSKDWVATEDESVVDGVVNLDMIAYNHNDADTAMIYGSEDWRAKWVAAAAEYAPDINIVEYPSNLSASDHWPFQAAGRPAGGIIENDYPPVPNPHYHKQTDNVDTPGYIDYDFAVRLLASGVGLLLEEADLLLTGDADNDDQVAWGDLATLADYIGTTAGATWATCDFDDNQRVDAADYAAMKRNYGQAPQPTGPAGVPEPTTLLLLASGIAAGAVRRQRR